VAAAKKKKKRCKDEQIHVRVSHEQHTTFVRAADEAGVSLSSWVVSTCLQAVRQ